MSDPLSHAPSDPSPTAWQRYQHQLIRYSQPDLWLDPSRMGVDDDSLADKTADCHHALSAMAELEAGAFANPDEGRMVGHYWLRDPAIAPTSEIRQAIELDIASSRTFAADVHLGRIAPPGHPRFTRLLLIGIGGSALGPQLVADALQPLPAPLSLSVLDNTDPDGIDRILTQIAPELATTLVVVISKSGGTPETRNGMLETQHVFARHGIDFAPRAVAVTGQGSKLDQIASSQGWLRRFPMQDWVGGRTSVMHTVGLVPLRLLGIDMDQLLAGAAAMDTLTRSPQISQNAALMLALAWHHAGQGKGLKDMVVLPYKDRLALFSRYLQQLVMESLGKRLDLSGQVVHQGLAVYGNKGSTDQHAYVQQLRDGIDNFFVTFLEVLQARDPSQTQVEVEPGASSGDFLQGFLRGTRDALSEGGRASITITIPHVDAFHLGALIALYERAVGLYASLINVNAYHQPGVEAGKLAAAEFLTTLSDARAALASSGTPLSADELAETIGTSPERAYHCLNHLAANTSKISVQRGKSPALDLFSHS